MSADSSTARSCCASGEDVSSPTTGASQQRLPDRDEITENLRLVCHRELRTLAASVIERLVT